MTAPASEEPTCSGQVLWALVSAVEEAGVPRLELLRTAGVELDRLHAIDARVRRSELDRMCELGMDLAKDPALGLHWAEGISQQTFAPVSHMIAHARSLRHGFELLSRFGRLFTDEAYYELLERSDRVEVRVLGLAARSPNLQRFSAEMIVAGFVCMARALLIRPRIERVSFEYVAPSYHTEYARVLGQPVHFDEPFTGIVVERAQFDASTPQRYEDTRAPLASDTDRRLLRASRHPPCALRVRELLVKRGPTRCNMAAVARALGFSVRSLRRRLADEGKSYLDVEHDALAFVAKRLLRDKQRTIQETAYEMGFAHPTTFHRAFKRWTGTTPSAFQDDPSRRP
jgi:AraC-like DNA-binding protein